MPADALLLSIFIVAVFAFFAVVVAWTDYTTTKWQKSKTATASEAIPERKKAA